MSSIPQWLLDSQENLMIWDADVKLTEESVCIEGLVIPIDKFSELLFLFMTPAHQLTTYTLIKNGRERYLKKFANMPSKFRKQKEDATKDVG